MVGLACGVLMLGSVGVVSATSLTSAINMDNSFELYLSTDDNVQGTLINSGYYNPSDDSGYKWWNTITDTATLNKGQDYFIHVHGIDMGGPAGFLGSFSLAGADHSFVNGTNNLLTNGNDWEASSSGWNNYTAPTTWGKNGMTSLWLNYTPDNSSDAIWLWSGNNNSNNFAWFSTKISANTAPVPEPATMLLFGTGIAGLVGSRLKRKNQQTT